MLASRAFVTTRVRSLKTSLRSSLNCLVSLFVSLLLSFSICLSSFSICRFDVLQRLDDLSSSRSRVDAVESQFILSMFLSSFTTSFQTRSSSSTRRVFLFFWSLYQLSSCLFVFIARASLERLYHMSTSRRSRSLDRDDQGESWASSSMIFLSFLKWFKSILSSFINIFQSLKCSNDIIYYDRKWIDLKSSTFLLRLDSRTLWVLRSWDLKLFHNY